LNNQEDFALFNLGGAFGQIPLIQNTTTDTFVAERFYRFSSVVEVPVPTGQAGSVSPSGGTNPVAVFDGETLSMSAPSATTGGRSIMVVQAEDSVGNQVQDTFSVLVSANYESWRRAVFSPDEVALDAISGPDADPNGDGVTNFVLFVQGLPTDIDARGLVRLPRLNLSETNNELEIDTPFITGVNFEVEESDDLLDWDLVSAVESVTDGLSGRTIQFTLPQGFPTSFKAFYRIRYTLESTNP